MKVEWANNGEPVDGHYIATIDLEDGKAVQKFSGATHKEVADKLMVAQGHATQRIRQLKERETPTPAAPAPNHQPRQLSGDERFTLTQELQDPTKAPEAIGKIVEAATGVKLADIGKRLTTEDQEQIDKENTRIMREWASETQEYVWNDHNADLIANYGDLNNLAMTKTNLDHIWEKLKDAGLAVLENSTAPAPGAQAGDNDGGLPPARPRGVISQTGVRRGDSSGLPTKGKDLKYTVAQIEAMGEEEYDNKLQTEPGFAEAVRVAYQKQPKAAAR